MRQDSSLAVLLEMSQNVPKHSLTLAFKLNLLDCDPLF